MKWTPDLTNQKKFWSCLDLHQVPLPSQWLGTTTLDHSTAAVPYLNQIFVLAFQIASMKSLFCVENKSKGLILVGRIGLWQIKEWYNTPLQGTFLVFFAAFHCSCLGLNLPDCKPEAVGEGIAIRVSSVQVGNKEMLQRNPKKS